MKLGEAVEWLERNYDRYQLIRTASTYPYMDLLSWVSPENEPCLRWEMGIGSSHRQPMVTVKYDREMDWHAAFHWYGDGFVPLCGESEAA